MKSILSFLVMCFAAITVNGQDTTLQLDYNNVNATVTNEGHFFKFDSNNSATTGYIIPKGSGMRTIYTSALWYVAENDSGELLSCLGGYGGSYDVDPGPISTTDDYSDLSYDNSYTISLCQAEIDQFKLWWECSNGTVTAGCATVQQPSVEVLNSIYSWPAHGDISLGQDYYLAPFYDRDGDGTYDPVGQGDYPIIKGCCATYMIQNDEGRPHTFSGTDPIGIEMHYMFYQYGANDLLYNTTFIDVLAINKGGTNYPHFSQGFYVDGDVGNPFDDYIGSDSTNNMLFMYNADNLDEDFGGQTGYQANPPAIGFVALESPITAAVPYVSSGQNPVIAAWNQMNGLQFDGSPWIHSNGYATSYVYSGNPNDASAWNESSAGNVTGDRRVLLSTSYDNFNAGDTVKQTYAILYSRIGNNLENAEHLSILAAEAKYFYDSGDTDCDAGGFVSTPELESAEISIYPNPNNGVFTIESSDAQLQSIRIIDVTGKEVSFEKEENGLGLNISLKDARSGVYIITIQAEKGQIVERLIVE